MHSNNKKAQKTVTYSSHKNDQLLYQKIIQIVLQVTSVTIYSKCEKHSTRHIIKSYAINMQIYFTYTYIYI